MGGVEIVARGLRKSVAGGRAVLDDVSFAIRPGELVAIAGGSGAGKTTLLEALAGARSLDAGTLLFNGEDAAALRTVLGYVPQDDIIHADLPLERTLRYAARLRLPRGADVDAAVKRALETLDLAQRADVRVAALSGGQRKRASIAVELLADPHAFFLDEPTSGLDPATGAELLRALRALAAGGATVVFTTHAVQDVARSDRVLFLGPGGVLAFDGAPEDAPARFGVQQLDEVYERLAGSRLEAEPPAAAHAAALPRRAGAGFARQWAVLSARTLETLARNPLTVAILLGSPAMVVAMFVVLFRAGAFDRAAPSPTAITMILFWVAFGVFFFGLTYGLLQVVSERAIVRREQLVGQRLGAYLLSKVTVLLPFLLLVDVLMLAVLRALDRLPAASAGTYAALGVTLLLEGAAALTLGLVTSALVRNPAQATLALPMLCFPAVLFSGAILPVHVMAGAGAAISVVVPVRWAFEAIGHSLRVRSLLLGGGSPLGPPLVRSYGRAGEASLGAYWLYLAAFAAVFFAGAWLALRRACRRV